MKKTYQGGCHCGAVRFQALIDLDAGTSRCNCSFCSKARWWGARVTPEDFTLLAGGDALSTYTFGSHSMQHQFCRHCGVRPFGHGSGEWAGGAFVAINVAALDGIDDDELAALPIMYCDGRANNWWEKPRVTAHL